MTYHERYMRLALAEAQAAFDVDEVPVGAVVVCDDTVIASAGNRMRQLSNPTMHAEAIVIDQALMNLGSLYLDKCTLYVTLEPCPMCAGSMVLAKLKQLVYGAADVKAGSAGTLYSITNDARLNHVTETLGGVLDSECAAILKKFFQLRR